MISSDDDWFYKPDRFPQMVEAARLAALAARRAGATPTVIRTSALRAAEAARGPIPAPPMRHTPTDDPAKRRMDRE